MIAPYAKYFSISTRLRKSRPIPHFYSAPVIIVPNLHLRSFASQAMSQLQDYSKWSHEQLQDRLKLLDAKLERLEKQVAKFESPNVQFFGRKADSVGSGPTASKFHDDLRDKSTPKRPRRSEKEFDPSKYSSRLIALKLAYLGKNYNGFEYHPNNETPLPTVEETLWKALTKGRLISPSHSSAIPEGEPNFEGCEYSKCGRTDKGVSAFGQVIGIRVRSNRPLSRASTPVETKSAGLCGENEAVTTPQIELAAPALREYGIGYNLLSSAPTLKLDEKTVSFHPIHDEIPYCQIINRLLPPDIRILAWCPAPPINFSARFSCGERHYTYFFTQPAFTPTPGSTLSARFGEEEKYRQRREGYLNISAMKVAAKKFEGSHDFRNFCKVDPSKQMDNFERRIFHASIAEQTSSDNSSNRNFPASYLADPTFQEFISQNGEASPSPSPQPASLSSSAHTSITPSSPEPKLYAFHLHGNAFLWHQVRHMVAILFLIGQGFEPPSLIDDLLDTVKTPCKPLYEMADAVPLVLSNCHFPRGSSVVVDPATGRAKDALEWVHVGDDMGREQGSSLLKKRMAGKFDGRYGVGGVVDDLWRVWRGRKMDEVLAGRLLDVVARQGSRSKEPSEELKREEPGNARDLGGKVVKELDRSSGLKGRNGGSGSGDEISSPFSQKLFHGGDGIKYVGTYVPVLKKPRMEPVEVVNERYRQKKGFAVGEEVKAEGWRKVPLLGRQDDGDRNEDKKLDFFP